MRRTDVDAFEKLVGQLIGLYDELSILSRKRPSDAVSEFKLRFINDIVSQANQFLGENYAPFAEFEVFDEDDVPQNSDVVFILSQYLQCFEKYRADNVKELFERWYWIVDPEPGETPGSDGKIHLPTVKPGRLRE